MNRRFLAGLILWALAFGPALGELYLNYDNDELFDETSIGLKWGIGYTYSDALSDRIEEDEERDWDDDDDCDDGDWGWVELNVGLEIPVNLHIAANPRLSLYFNTADDDYLNSMLVPAFGVRILWETDGSLTDYWYPYAGYFPFVDLEVNYNFPLGGEPDFDDGGVGGAVLIGHQLPYNFDIAAGFSYIPVDFEDDACENMGGFVLRVQRTFW